MNEALNHVAIVLGSMRMGGAERATLNLINELVEKGISCDLVLVHKEGEFLNAVNPKVRVIGLGKSRTIFSAFSFCQYLKKFNPQVILCGQTHVQLMVLWSRNRVANSIPVILNEHSIFSKNLPKSFFKRQSTMLLVKRFFHKAEAITAVSKKVAEDLVTILPSLQKKVLVIYNSVIVPSMLEQSLLKPNLPWKSDLSVPIILGAGRLVRDKDFKTLVEAVAIVRKSRRVRLVILGDGEEKDSLLSLAEKLNFENDISLPGYTNNPYAWMSVASVFVLSSRREGLPMVLIEALACGCKVVSTDCESGPFEILDNGKYGKLVPVVDANAMAEAILTSLADSQEGLKEMQHLDAYRSHRIADEYIVLMQKLISTGGNVKA